MSERSAEPEPRHVPRDRLGASAVAAAVMIVAATLLGLASLVLLQRAARSIEQDHTMSIRLERLLSTMKDLETGVRGYVLTGQDPYLGPYHQAVGRLDGEVNALEGLPVDLAPIRTAVAERRAAAAATLDDFHRIGLAGLLQQPTLGTGREAMDRLRSLVADSQAVVDARMAATESRETGLYWPMGIAAFMVLLGAFALIARLAAHRREAERTSAGLLQDIMDNAPIGLGVMDRSLVVRHINPALAGMGAAETGRHGRVSLWDVLPDQREALEPKVRKVLTTGRPTTADLVVEEAQSERGRAYQATIFPFRTATGTSESAGIGLVLADVTARRRAERRLQDSELRFRTLTESSAAVIWSAGPEGLFDRPQPRWAAFTGQSEEAMRGLGWLAAVHPEERRETEATWANAVSTRTVYAMEHRLWRADREWRYMAAIAVPILDDEGNIREWIGTHTDITERKEAEAELAAAKNAAEASNRAKSAFLANMSHELRTPLSAVIGYSEMLEEEIEDLGEKRLLRDVGKIKANARHLLGLINDVLDLSKIEANKMDTHVETVDVASMIEDVASTTDSLVHAKNNSLVVAKGADLGTMRTDVVKLRQCLLNLLSNAAKFTENGRVTLAAERTGPGPDATIAFRVSDTGIGMTAEQVSRLFQRFAQADETTTRKFGGTGLGLALTRAFSRLLGGDVKVDSVVGEGTSFTLTIPVLIPAAPAEASGEDEPEQEPEGAPLDMADGGSREVVLVVDDDSAQRDLIVRFLDRQGFAARTAPDGVSGLAMARQIKPRAILLDVMMPQMDGWQVLNALKGDPDLGQIPVVMVTFTSDKGLSRTLGAAEHISKPVDWDELRGVMDRLRDSTGDILVVDDDPEVRDRLRATLERHGWTVQEASNGREALAKVKHGPPRAILLDLTMPVMDGFTFLHQLRAVPGHKDIPVIVFSARDISAGEMRELAQADRVLSKTAGLRELAGELEKLAPRAAAEGLAADRQRTR